MTFEITINGTAYPLPPPFKIGAVKPFSEIVKDTISAAPGAHFKLCLDTDALRQAQEDA